MLTVFASPIAFDQILGSDALSNHATGCDAAQGRTQTQGSADVLWTNGAAEAAEGCRER
jgi:hypothetical protein